MVLTSVFHQMGQKPHAACHQYAMAPCFVSNLHAQLHSELTF